MNRIACAIIAVIIIAFAIIFDACIINVYDMDGSDQMASYLYVSARLDTLLAK